MTIQELIQTAANSASHLADELLAAHTAACHVGEDRPEGRTLGDLSTVEVLLRLLGKARKLEQRLYNLLATDA